MFASFGPQARRVIELAEDHARALWRPAVGPEHLLLALLAVDDSGVLHRAGLRFDDVRAILLDASAGDDGRTRAARNHGHHLPLRLREVFRDAFRHAASAGAFEVLPLHLALALVEPVSGEVALVLRKAEVDVDDVRHHLRAELADGRVGTAATAANVVTLRRRLVDRRDPGSAAEAR